jgi:hypothetical protein
MNNNLIKVKSRALSIAVELRKNKPNMRRISALRANMLRFGKYYRQDINA